AAKLASMPIDPDIALKQNLGFSGDGAVYNSIHIGDGAVVPSGNYVLLPGYYGLLPGAYLVQVQSGSAFSNLQAGQTARLQNGLTVVPGYMTAAGTSLVSPNTIGVVVRPGSDIGKLAQYTVSNSSYFATLAAQNEQPVPPLPVDGGHLTI